MPRSRKPRKHRNRGSARLAALAWLNKHGLIDPTVTLTAECGEVVLIKPEDLLRVEPTLILNKDESSCIVVFACRPSGSEDDVLVYFDPALLPAKSRSQVKFAIQHYRQHVHTQISTAASN